MLSKTATYICHKEYIYIYVCIIHILGRCEAEVYRKFSEKKPKISKHSEPVIICLNLSSF